jgi:hypothetical protein
MSTDPTRDGIIRETQRIEEDSLYSSKGHFDAAKTWKTVHFTVGCACAMLSAIAGASALSQFSYHNVVAGVISILVTALTAGLTFLRPDECSAAHSAFARQYAKLRNAARIFRDVDVRGRLDTDELRQRLVSLNEERDRLNTEAPQIPSWAFRRARRGIVEGEADYATDDVDF